MYIFSVNAAAKQAVFDLKVGEVAPFIVYINFLDLLGAEHLCKLYLLKEGFTDIQIDKRKRLSGEYLQDSKALEADTALQDALKTGYHIQLFEAH